MSIRLMHLEVVLVFTTAGAQDAQIPLQDNFYAWWLYGSRIRRRFSPERKWGSRKDAWQQSEAIKYYLIWILVYVVALATVKSSVCITIRRIASIKKPMRITVWVLLAVTWASFLVTFVGTLAYCQPVRSLCE